MFNEMRVVSLAVFVLAVLNYIDLYTTHYAISSGIAEEANPFAAKMIEDGVFEEVKLAISLALYFAAFFFLELERKLWWILQHPSVAFILGSILAASSVVSLMYAVVVANNIAIIMGW